jgi:hypothetical protein
VDLDDFFILGDNFSTVGPVDVSDCSSSDLNDSEAVSEPNTTGAFELGGDITGALAFSRLGDRTTYANNYVSEVTDLVSGNTFAGDVAISVSGGKCVFNTKAMPNHEMGEDRAFATSISEQSLTYEITTSPIKAAAPTENIWKASVVLLNGGAVDILPAACYGEGDSRLAEEKIGCGADLIDHPWRYDAMSPLNSFGTDIHNAHVQPDSVN